MMDSVKRCLRALCRGAGLFEHLDGLEDSVRSLRHATAACRYEASRADMIQLRELYKRMTGECSLEEFRSREFRNHSQNGEDGLLWYIFSRVGITNRRVVEVCAGDGVQCNAANLIINDGWDGLLFDGDATLVARGNDYYKRHVNTRHCPPLLQEAWITRSTVNDLIETAGFGGEIDLLSLDLDGVDYWIWDALDVVRPRVVLVEVQVIWGMDRCCTVPYADDFCSPLIGGYGVYSGASLPAFVKLGERKGYRLIGCEKLGYNAFFLRNDVGSDIFAEVDGALCLDVPFVRLAREQFGELVESKEWCDV